jgi:hypothetical protein
MEGRAKAGAWKSLLLALSLLAACWVVWVAIHDNLGLGGRPWYGWWDSYRTPAGRPYSMVFEPPRAGGATARAGIRARDVADLRDQDYAGRIVLLTQPLASQPTVLRVRRGTHIVTVGLQGSTIWEGSPLWKLSAVLPPTLAGIVFLVCAALIAVRRAETRDGRLLALVLLGLVPGFLPQNSPVVPDANTTLAIWAVAEGLGMISLALLVALASRHGTRNGWRTALEAIAYASIVLVALRLVAFLVGTITLAFDPVPFWWLAADNFTVGATLAATIVCGAAVYCTPRSERPRSTWLLVPLPVALFLSTIATLAPRTTNWFGGIALNIAGSLLILLGALVVTYGLLKRRVFDFEFVLSRALIVAIISAIVVGSFALLEWTLSTVVVGVSHATGLVANGALALALGLSLNPIHKRVDAFIDSVVLRKRHEDERALRDFATEAAYVTDFDALLDCATERIRLHTDARSGALLLERRGVYAAVRSFGDGLLTSVPENDGAILALKAWRKPIDPHNHDSALRAAMVLPMIVRGRLRGAVVLGERAGSEAYAPDEIDALSQFAAGVASALEALTAEASDLRETIAGVVSTQLEPLHFQLDAIARQLRSVRG